MHLQSHQAEFLRRLLRHGPGPHVQRALRKFHPAELAELLAELPVPDRRRMVEALAEARLAAPTLRELPDPLLTEVLADLSPARLAAVVHRLAQDDAGYFLHLLPESRREAVLELLPPDSLQALKRFLAWPLESAGRLATDRYIMVPEEATISEAVDLLRHAGDRADQSLFYLYAVDGQGRLQGVLPIRPLLTRDPSTPVREIMRAEPVRVLATDSQRDAADTLTMYELLAVPVVDAEGKLVGVITVDDVIEVIAEDAAEDVVRLAGVSEGDRPLGSPLRSLRKRLPWMCINVGTALLAASVVGMFEDSIDKAPLLATFMPVVAGMGGNTGTQALAVMTRGIALDEVPPQKVMRAVGKELLVGLSIGAIMGMVVAGVAWVWKGNPWLGLVLFLAMLANLTVAGVAGAAVPLAVRAMGGDPAVGAGVILTTFTDVCGFLAFLGVATLFLGRILG